MTVDNKTCCKIAPFRICLQLGAMQRVNGRIVGGWRVFVCTIRGFQFALFSSGFNLGRNNISRLARKWDCYSALIARAYGLLDTVQFLLFGPLALVVNILVFVVSACLLLLLGAPLAISNKTRPFARILGIIVLTLPFTILLNLLGFVFVPLQILFPELVALINFSQWDTLCNENTDLL